MVSYTFLVDFHGMTQAYHTYTYTHIYNVSHTYTRVIAVPIVCVYINCSQIKILCIDTMHRYIFEFIL